MGAKKTKVIIGITICIFITAILLVAIFKMFGKFKENSVNKITYKINNKCSEHTGHYKKGYYINNTNGQCKYIIAMGACYSEGYSIKITNVKIDKNNNVTVTVQEKSPEWGQMEAQLITYPICELKLSGEPNSITVKDVNGNNYERVQE